jgi:hypothetical protein
MYPTWFAWLIWLPSLVVIPIVARARAPAPLAIAALAVWTALQIGGIAVTRSLPVPVLAPRYYDIFAVGIVANGVLGAWFVRASAGRGPILAAAILGLCAWSIYVGFSGWRFARSHTRLDVPAMRAIADGQIDLLQRYYGGEGATVLRSAKFPVLPYPEPAYLENLLPEPAIRNSLPAFIVSPSAGDKGCNLAQRSWPGESGLRRASWLWISLGLGTLALGGYLAVAIRAAPLQPTQDTR